MGHLIARCRWSDGFSFITSRDPLEQVRRLLLDNDFADASELKKLEKVRRKCENLRRKH